MLIEEIKNIKSGKKELREFGLIMSVVLSFINLFLFWKRGEVFSPLVVFSALFLFFSFVGHRLLRPLYKIWMTFSLIVGKSVTAIILVILFYLVLTPTGLIVKLLNKDLLGLKLSRKKNSYWLEKDQSQKLFYEKQS